MQEYSVALLIAGDDLDETEVSNELGLQPTILLKKGEPMSANRLREQTSWSFEVCPSPDNLLWHSLDDGLRCLAEKLSPLKNALNGLRQHYSVQAYCGHFGSGFGVGPSISPETLHMLADLRLTLTIKTYWSEDECTVDAEIGERGG